MKKIFVTLLLVFSLFITFGVKNTFASSDYKYLDEISDVDNGYDITITKDAKDGEGISNFAIKVANSLRIVFIAIAVIYFLIRVIVIIGSNNTEEEIGKFKKGFIWISVGLILTNIAVAFVKNIYNGSDIEYNSTEDWDMDLVTYADNVLDNIVNPFIELLKFGASFFFILVSVYAFFRLITANGNEDSVKKGRMTIFYAIIGFIIVKISSDLALSVYGRCSGVSSGSLFNMSCNRTDVDVSKTIEIITSIINWLNSFVAIIVIIMIIFSGIQLMFSNGDEEKMKKVKKSLVYIVIGVGILLFDYFILTFIPYNNL